ncbi:MAG: hypothetical protein K0S80_2927, partial [Neobacillus sp.]|nr:hypothetical protein [Neobacillus sp.]
LSQVTGKTTISPVFIDGSKLDVRTGKVFYDDGFEISSDFTLKMWIEDIVPNEDLVYLKGSNGTIRVQYKSDHHFHMYKTVGEFINHYTTGKVTKVTVEEEPGYFISPYQYNEGDVTTAIKYDTLIGNGYFLCIQQINGKMNLIGEIIN